MQPQKTSTKKNCIPVHIKNLKVCFIIKNPNENKLDLLKRIHKNQDRSPIKELL